MSTIDEEIEVMRSIFCQKGEFEVIQRCDKSITVNMAINGSISDSCIQCVLNVTLTFTPEYPKELPKINLSSDHLTKTEANRLKCNATDIAKSLLDEPFMMDFRSWLEDNWTTYCNKSSSSSLKHIEDDTSMHWCLLQLDHMRAKGKYTKTILKWTKELNIQGRLIFCNRLILLLLQGSLDSIKEYISLQKTVSVDVDSKGRSCKERMLTQICSPEILQQQMHKFEDFQTIEFNSDFKLEENFDSIGLIHIYREHLQLKYKKQNPS